MYRGTIGDYVINQGLPEQFRQSGRVLDKKGIDKLLSQVAKEAPDKFSDVIQHLSNVGRFTAQMTGGHSFGPEHMRLSIAGRRAQVEIKQKILKLFDDPKLSDEDREKEIVNILDKSSDQITQDVYKESLAEHNPLAMQVLSGARGNALNLRELRAGPLMYVDHRNRPIPFPVLRSYSQGLSPAEFFASTFGARRGVIDVKQGVRNAGFFSKQLVQSMHRLLVTALDSDQPHVGSPRGLPTTVDDPDNEGALLAMDTGPYQRNTVLTPKIIADLKNRGIAKLLVRSPLAGGPPDGGVYGRDVGVREKGGLAPVGDFVGIAAAQALCLSKGTLVRMADGSAKEVENIAVGDLVLGCSAAGVVSPVRVLGASFSGRKECVRTVFRRGTGRTGQDNMLELVSTSEHKILSTITPRSTKTKRDKQFVPTAVRPVGHAETIDRFCAQLSTSFDDRGMVAEPRALLLGLLIGNGSYTGNSAVQFIAFSCYDKTLTDGIESYVASLGFKLLRQAEGEYRLTDQDCFQMKYDADGNAYRHRFIQWLKDLGIWGQSSGVKTIPAAVHTWDNTSISQLIAGLLATDGWVSRQGQVGLGSNSKELLQQVKELLQIRFGVQSSGIAQSVKKHPDGGTYDPNYRISIAAARDIRSVAGSLAIPGVKGKRIAALVLRIKDKRGNYTDRCFRVSQANVGARDTYDLWIDHPDHLFLLANGLVVSNSEPITQSGLSSKHQGGIAGAKGMSGFDTLNLLVQVPKAFKGGAAHAQDDGRVNGIRPAPQGGSYVNIGGKDHYVAHGYDIKVKPGQEVEAGDVISEGLPNPSEAVKHKGLGEGSRYFVDTFTKAAREAGINVHRRNIELLARGLINHVELDSEWNEHVPGDVVSYRRLEHKYEPREGHEVVPVAKAKGQYLEAPVLHYSIGTRLRPSVIQTLSDYGVQNVAVHKDPPPFKPLMIRGMENVAHDEDWMTRFLGSYLKKNFLTGVHRSDVSDEAGTSYVPSLAQTREFGQKSPVKGWTPTGPVPKAPTPHPSILKQMYDDAPPAHDSIKSMFTQPKAAAAAANPIDPFSAFVVDHPAGVTQSFVDDYDDDDDDTGYPLREITYPVDHGRLPGYKGEDGEDLAVLRGTDPKGESGSFRVSRLEPWRTKTKFYHQCSPHEKDQLLRAFAPILSGRPTTHKTSEEISAALEPFRSA